MGTNVNGRKICRVIKEEDVYILEDCNGEKICKVEWDGDKTSKKVYKYENEKWEEKKDWEITSFLKEKTSRYTRNDANEHRVWRLGLGIKKEDKCDYEYINIASCRYTSFDKEINRHINQLLYITKNEKYQQLWKRTNEVVFEEIDVDEYIDKCINKVKKEKMDPYLYSLIKPSKPPKAGLMKGIFDKLRAHYVEGRLAWEYGMKEDKKRAEELGEQYDGGIWNPGTGIDKEVYMYYKK